MAIQVSARNTGTMLAWRRATGVVLQPGASAVSQKTLTQHLFGAVSKAVVLGYVRSESDAAAAEPSPMCWSACSWLEHGDASLKVAEVGAEADVGGLNV